MEENESQSTYSSFTSPVQSRRSGKKKKVLLLIAAIVILSLVAFGISRVIGNKGISTESDGQTPTPLMTPTTTPTPTETDNTPTPTSKSTPTPTKTTSTTSKNISVQILNGGGVAGAGKVAADLLTGLGYNVVSTGNADNFDYANTTIQIKSLKSGSLAQLKKDLSAKYTVGSTSTDLSASSSADAIVIVGKQ